MTAKLRATIFSLSGAVTAWYYVHHAGDLSKASLEVQNFQVAVQSSIKDTEDFSNVSLCKLLHAGIVSLEDDPCATSLSVVAAIQTAQRVYDELAPVLHVEAV